MLINNHKNLANSGRDIGHFPAQSLHVISLFQMIELAAQRMYLLHSWLEEASCKVYMQIWKQGEAATLTAEDNQDLHGRVNDIITFLDELNNPENERTEPRLRHRFQRTVERLQVFSEVSPHVPFNRPAPLGVIANHLQEVRRALKADLAENRFLSISALELEKYDQDQLFGPQVYDNFPSTRMDVAEAGNCYALGRYTACVFHCMRVVEKGLHAFVADLNARSNANVKFSSHISYQNWGNIINTIERELKELMSRQPPLDRDLRRFYSQTVTQFIYIKDAWRNEVAHSRSTYDEPSAYSIMEHVKTFMVRLCKEGLTEI